MSGASGAHRTRYRVGDTVRVKSAEAVAATLDQAGTLNGLPFMPEMVALCGRTFSVRASAHKTCDGAGGLRAMDSAVHLDGVHCDGSAHGGCESRCPLFFKDAWLEPADAPDLPAPDAAATAASEAASPAAGSAPPLAGLAKRSVRLHGRDPAAGTYSCQSTEVIAATRPLGLWSLRQCWDDLRSGNVALSELLRWLPVMIFNKYQDLSGRLPRRLRIRGGARYPLLAGRLARGQTPDVRIGLRAGDRVVIRRHGSILGTLDTTGANRGLGLDADMVPFCGQRAVVHHRVNRRIDERTGQLVELRNPCVVLDGVACRGRYHRFCPRALDSYWREAWLERQAGA